MTILKRAVSTDQYVHELSAWLTTRRVWDTDFAIVQDAEAYEKMRRDPVIEHAMQARKHMVAGPGFFLEPASDRAVDKRAAQVMEFLHNQVGGFATARFALAEAVLRGSAWAEKRVEERELRAPEDGQYRPWKVVTSLKPIDKRRFRMVRENDGSYCWELAAVGPQNRGPLEHGPIQRRYLARKEGYRVGEWHRWAPANPEVYLRHVYNDDEGALGHGRGLAEALYLYWFAKSIVLEKGLDFLDRWEGGLVKVGIDGLRSGAVTDDAAAARAAKWLTVIEKMRSRHVVVHDKADDVGVVDAPAGGWSAATQALAYFDNGIRVLLLGSNLPTSATEGGSYALAQVQENSTEMLIQYDRRTLEETLDGQLTAWLWKWNWPQLVALGLGDARRPWFRIKQEQKIDHNARATNLVTVRQAGLQVAKADAYEQTGWRMPGEDEEVLPPMAAPTVPNFSALYGAPVGYVPAQQREPAEYGDRHKGHKDEPGAAHAPNSTTGTSSPTREQVEKRGRSSPRYAEALEEEKTKGWPQEVAERRAVVVALREDMAERHGFDSSFLSETVPADTDPVVLATWDARFSAARESGLELPRKILVRKPEEGKFFVASYRHGNDQIVINPDVLEPPQDKYNPNWSAVKDGKDLLEHELGHRAHYLADRESFQKRFDALRKSRTKAKADLTNDERKLAYRHVSDYGASQPLEFVAEAYVRLRRGEELPAEVMAIYQKYGGPPWTPRKKTD